MSTPTPTGNGHSNGHGPTTGQSRWVVPDEAMLIKLANEVLGPLAEPGQDDPAPDDPEPDDPGGEPLRLSSDLVDLPVSTIVPAVPARGDDPPEPPAVPARGDDPSLTELPSNQPSFYFIVEQPGFSGKRPMLSAGMPAFSVDAVRADFPILAERINGRQLVWFDNAATTHKPQAVIDRIAYFYAHENSNIHRGAHTLAARATDAYEDARSKVAVFIGAASSDDIVFTRGTTEAINLIAHTWGSQHVGPGDEIVVSHLEHHANIVPWQQLAAAAGAKLRVIPVDDDGQLRLDGLRALLNDRTKLVAVAHVSNVLGTIVPVDQVIALAHRAGALVLIDGAQAVAHTPVQVQTLDADFYVFSGHKVFGPTGIGALYAKPELLAEMPPWQGGGNMIDDVTFERTRFQRAPARFEAGTGNIADAIGLGAALDYVSGLGWPAISEYEHQLFDYASQQIAAVPGLRLIGTARQKTGLLTFTAEGHHAADIGAALDRAGIAVRAGHHCAQPILRRYGLESAVRPSLAMYNTRAEVDLLVGALGEILPAGSRLANRDQHQRGAQRGS
jgi:cysteine desulfurase/selenocysteine lyase